MNLRIVHRGRGLERQWSLDPPCTEQQLARGACQSKRVRPLRGVISRCGVEQRERRRRETSPMASTTEAEAESSHQ
jgi:hypothetical protein